MRTHKMAMAFLLAAVALVPAAQAQNARDPSTANPHFGLQGSLGDDNVNLGLGARYENSMRGLFPAWPNLRFIGSFDYFFPDSPVHYWEANADVVHMFTWRGARVVPYAGGGLNVARAYDPFGGSTETGLNIAGGLRLPGQYRPYLEGRLEMGGGNRFVMTLGWLFW